MSDILDQPMIAFESQDAWAAWLAAQHASAAWVWLKLAKKGSGIASVSNAEALDVALCYGWIDGQRRALDDDYFLQRYSPRTPRSKWSKINRDHVARLSAAGRMQPAGLREVERARADGRWEAAYDSPRNVIVPEDLARALARNEVAREFFATLDSRNRYAVLYRIQDAKRPETRARRIEQFVALLAEGKKVYP